MSDLSPQPLRPAHTPSSWLAKRPFGFAAAVLGLLTFVVVAAVQDALWSASDLRLGIPGFALTAIASGVSVARREGAYALWLPGLGLAGAALVLGWFLMVTIVVAATAILMLIVHALM